MASAGHAQAHSSHPMHFSRPSGHRLSWCLPWNLGAVGRFSSGYSTVSTLLNICLKVTPKPLIGFRKSSTGNLLLFFLLRPLRLLFLLCLYLIAGRRQDAVVVRQVHR